VSGSFQLFALAVVLCIAVLPIAHWAWPLVVLFLGLLFVLLGGLANAFHIHNLGSLSEFYSTRCSS
jgi:hypothetical protein